MTTEEAINFLTNKLSRDRKFWDTYKANIAYIFQSEFNKYAKKYGEISAVDDIHEISNTAAEEFLKLWCSK